MSSVVGKRLLVLGGMQISCEIIRKAQRMGAYVMVTDYNTADKSPGKKIADKSFMVSTTDVDEVVRLIKEENIDGVLVGFVDVLLPYYADICRKAGLPAYGTREQFEILINKDRYKKLCREYNVPTVEEYHIDDVDFEHSINNIHYPVLVKPADSSGARGITICNNKEELVEAYRRAENYSRTGNILIERYLTGREVTVFWIFQDGQYYLSAIGNRHVKRNQEGVIPLPVGYTFPASILEKYRKDIEPNVKAMLHSIGIKDGMMFMQCKLEEDSCIVYDIGYRLTGSLEYKIIEAICGYDPLEMMIHFALTGKMADHSIADKINPMFPKFAFNVSLLSKPGKIRKLIGYNEILMNPEVVDAVIAHYPGETITEDMKGLLAQITMRVLGTAESKEQLGEIMTKIQNTFHIISESGEEMLLPGLELADLQGCI